MGEPFIKEKKLVFGVLLTSSCFCTKLVGARFHGMMDSLPMTWLNLILILSSVFGILAAFIFLFRTRIRRKVIRPFPREFKIQKPEINLTGVRYENPGSRPLVLVHGYAGNSRNWRELGYALFKKGFDIWMPNLRGHGKGAHRSFVPCNEEGRYGFRYIVTEDLPAIVEHVFENTGQKMSIIGHSMGGIAVRAFLSGIHPDPAGNLVTDEDFATNLAKTRVNSVILMGSPPHFKNFPQALRFLLKQPKQLLELLQMAIPVPSPNHTPTAPDRQSFTEKIKKMILKRIHLTLENRNLIRGVVELKNFNQRKNEFSRLLEKGLSKIHLDLVRDMNRWIQQTLITSPDGFDFSQTRPIRVPLLFVAGEFDMLAPYHDVFAMAADYSRYTEIRTMLMKKTSHVDLIAGERAAKLMAPLLCRFVTEPNSLGKSSSHWEIDC